MTSRNLVPVNKLFTGSTYRFLTYNSNVAYPNPLSNIYNASGVEVMNISHSNVRIYGNVGIGTTFPTEKLHVVGNILSTGSIDVGTQFLGVAADTVSAPSYSWDGDLNTGMYRPGVDIIGLVTGGTERMRILANGFVGIGTTTPLSKLHVDGGALGGTSGNTLDHIRSRCSTTNGNQMNLRIFEERHTTGTDWSTTSLILQRVVDASHMAFIKFGVAGANSGLSLGAANTEAVRINDSGFVGIGTTSPQATLYVHGDISIFRESKIQFAIGSQLRAYIKSNNINNALEFGSEGVETMRIMTSTNFVGIGTTVPIQKLHVQGQIYASDNITAFSDGRYKTNIHKITNVVEKIKQISGYTYTKMEDASNKKYMGVIAQEVDKVFPEVIEKNGETLSVAYGNMVAPLIEVIKELIHRVEVLEARPY